MRASPRSISRLWFSQISKLLINWGLPFFVRFPCSPPLVALAAAFLAFFRQRTVTYSPQRPRPRTQGQAVVHCLRTLSLVAVDLVRLVALAARPRAALVAENLFLRKQLALFQERKVRPRRADDSTRWMMAALSQRFAWRNALVNVEADTLLL